MTKTEMVEIFSILMLAWPNAEMFKGGIEKLEPTIELWHVCLHDMDFWMAQRAAIKLCRECVFPPSIAEFKKKADDVRAQIGSAIHNALQDIRSANILYGSMEDFYKSLPSDSRTKLAIDAMGGPETLMVNNGGLRRWNLKGFEASYWSLVKNEHAPALSSQLRLAAPQNKKRELSP